ncbi:MAG: hypothetical protein EZS28_048408, partial [Streblomastix strix]
MSTNNDWDAAKSRWAQFIDFLKMMQTQDLQGLQKYANYIPERLVSIVPHMLTALSSFLGYIDKVSNMGSMKWCQQYNSGIGRQVPANCQFDLIADELINILARLGQLESIGICTIFEKSCVAVYDQPYVKYASVYYKYKKQVGFKRIQRRNVSGNKQSSAHCCVCLGSSVAGTSSCGVCRSFSFGDPKDLIAVKVSLRQVSFDQSKRDKKLSNDQGDLFNLIKLITGSLKRFNNGAHNSEDLIVFALKTIEIYSIIEKLLDTDRHGLQKKAVPDQQFDQQRRDDLEERIQQQQSQKKIWKV